MKATLPTLVALLALAAPATAREIQTVSKTFAIGSAREIEVEFSAGELTIEAGNGEVVEARMTAHCSRSYEACAERAERVRLVTRTRGARLVFELEGLPKVNHRGLSVALHLTVPATYPLHVDMGAGDLVVRGMADDVDVHMGAGDADLRLPAGSVGDVELTVGVGDVRLRNRYDRWDGSGFISRALRWHEGEGEAKVEVDLGVGDVDVALD